MSKDQMTFSNDYEAYDQSQGAAALHFEILRAKHYGLPEETIDFYIFIKLNALTFIGYLDIMRLTGEGPTFDANTAVNIAYDHTKYDIPKTVSGMYAGDDMSRDQVCKEKPSWKLIESKVTLKSKPILTKQPTFCGWLITKYGVIRDPFKLWFSYRSAKDRGQLHNVAVSYRQDLLPAYKLGDKLYDILTEEQMEYHRDTCRGLHLQLHLMNLGDQVILDNKLSSSEQPKLVKKTKPNQKQRARRRILRS